MKKKKVVLAFSGGLDTSVCVPWLMDRGYEVVCFMANLGQEQDVKPAIERGKIAGAKKVIVSDVRQEYIDDYVFPSLKMNALYENQYPLATSLTRPLIAKELVRVAHEEKATAVAHGCTGKGNDQVRIEMSVQILDPKLEIIAPVREWELKSREAEIAYLQKRNIPSPATKKSPYSIDKSLWGISIECGVLENPWTRPPKDAFVWTRGADDRNPKPSTVIIGFEKGIPVSLDGKRMPSMKLIQTLNAKGAYYGIGRIDMVENRFVGIKSRETYEAPAAVILTMAHRDLESITLDKMVTQYKDSMSREYANWIYQGYWFTKLRTAFDAFVNKTQENVTGEVRVELTKFKATVTGRRSPVSRYKEKLATYTEDDEFDQTLAKGFIDLIALPLKN